MKTEFLKTLWMLRFEKIKTNEDAAAWGYQEILDSLIEEFGYDHDVIKTLARLVKEERMHSKCADELIKICHQTHPEISVVR